MPGVLDGRVFKGAGIWHQKNEGKPMKEIDKKFVPMGIRPETLALLRSLKETTDVPYYRIIHDGVLLYREKMKKVKFSFEVKND